MEAELKLSQPAAQSFLNNNYILQALKQLQLQQQVVKQKLGSGGLQTGSNVQTKNLTVDQLKQIQLQESVLRPSQTHTTFQRNILQHC